MRELTREELLSFIGPPLTDSFMRVYGIPAGEAEELVKLYRKVYPEENLFKAKHYPGMMETLERLRGSGVRCAIASYKPERYVIPLLKHFGFDRYMDSIHGSDPGGLLTKADIISLCVRECGSPDNASVLRVGDSEYDARGAEALGMDFAAAMYGFGFAGMETLEGIPHVAKLETPDGLLDLLEK